MALKGLARWRNGHSGTLGRCSPGPLVTFSLGSRLWSSAVPSMETRPPVDHIWISLRFPLPVGGDTSWPPMDVGDLTSCPPAGVGTVGIVGPFDLSSFPFPCGEGAMVVVGVITLLFFHFICQRAQQGEDPVSAGCPRDKRQRRPSQDIFSTVPPTPSPLPPSPRFSWQRTKRENERTPFKALLSILNGAWIPFWMPDCWHSRSPRSLNCNSWGPGTMLGGCEHVRGGWSRNTSPLLPAPASVLLRIPSKTRSPGVSPGPIATFAR